MTDLNHDIDGLLDAMREDRTRAPATLRVSVLNRLHEAPQVNYDLVAWLGVSLWRPLCTAALPLLLGFGLGYAGWSQEATYDVDDLLLAQRPSGESLSEALATWESESE
jgi:hypothetical protein